MAEDDSRLGRRPGLDLRPPYSGGPASFVYMVDIQKHHEDAHAEIADRRQSGMLENKEYYRPDSHLVPAQENGTSVE